jgi:TAT (twin-arginine translocation) pathway signal sequence
MTTIDRRTFIKGAALAGAATLTLNQRLWAADDFDPIRQEIAKAAR